MTNLIVALFAYLIDKIWGEFRFITHPVIYIGKIITVMEG